MDLSILNPLAVVEKLINEHGSAVIINQQLALAKDRFSMLESNIKDFKEQISGLQTQIGRLEAQLEREQLDHQKARKDLQQLQNEHMEEVRIKNAIEFRRGKRTGGVWQAFCPKCHMPLNVFPGDTGVECSASCGWLSGSDIEVKPIISRLDSGQ